MNEFDQPDSRDAAHRRGDSSDELLDRLLEEARWPEPSTESIERSVAHWNSLLAERVSQTSKTGNNWRRWSAAAAVLFALGGLAWWGLADSGEVPVAMDQPAAIQPPENATAVVERAGSPQADVTAELPVDRPDDQSPSWRPPNAFEQLLVVAQQQSRSERATETSQLPKPKQPAPRKTARTRSGPKRATMERLNQWVAAAIVQVRDTPDVKIAELLEGIAAKERNKVEALLVKRLAETQGADRIAALQLLVPLATARSLPALRQVAQASEARDVALPALLRLEDSSRLAQSALVEPTLERRRMIFAQLWDREDPTALAIMFQLVSNDATRVDATASLRNAEQPPIEWLCDVMTQSPRTEDRTTAAELLGGLNSPDVTERLIQLTESAVSRQAALAGLLASSEPSALGFLKSAEQNPYLVASIWNARAQQSKP